MSTLQKRNAILLGLPLLAAVVAFYLGYTISDNSDEVRQLRAEIERLKRISVGRQLDGIARSGTGAHDPMRLHRELAPATEELAAKLGITLEDWKLTEDLARRREEGEYILKWEWPPSRKHLDRLLTGIVSEGATNRAGEYNRTFFELGLESAETEQLKTHLSKIHRASLEKEGAIQQVLESRRDYDRRLRSMLGGEDYLRYRQYEEDRSASREWP